MLFVRVFTLEELRQASLQIKKGYKWKKGLSLCPSKHHFDFISSNLFVHLWEDNLFC